MTFTRPRRMLLGAVAATVVLSLGAGCAASGAGGGAAQGNGERQEGGDVTFLIDSLGDTWVPTNSAISSFQGQVWGNLTDKLVYVDEQGEVSPWVAERWEQNEDATQFTLHLKDGVTFSDGTPLDADAVVANLDIWADGRPDEGINPIGLFPTTYEGSRAVDPQTVEVSFTAPTLGFIPTLGYHGSVLFSPGTLARPVEEQADLSNTVASGPFTVRSWKEGDNVVLEKRDDYDWGPEALGHDGPATLDTVTYKLVAEPSVRTAAVQSGQAQVAYNPSPQELDPLKEQGFAIGAPRYLGFVNGFAINTQVKPFDDVKVRQAVQRGIDREEILSTVYTSDWLPAESILQSNVPGASDHSDQFAYDPEAAAALLDEAGWTAGPDGKRSKGGKPLAMTLYPNPYLATSKSIDELVAQQLGDLGFTVDIQAYDVVTFGEKVGAPGNPSVPAYEITRSFIDAGTVAGVLTDAEGGEDWFNVGQSDSRLTELSNQVASSVSTEERVPVLDKLQRYVLDQAYFVPLTQIVQRLYLESPKLKGVTFNGVAYASFYAAYLEG